MAKKFGKFLAFAAIVGAAAGAYYYYKKKSDEAEQDDFDDFDDEDDISLEEYLKEEASQSEQTERSIRNIFHGGLSSETVTEAKESLKKAVKDIGEKVHGVADSVSGVVKSGSSSDAEKFQFIDLPSAEEKTAVEGDEIDIIDMSKPADESAIVRETETEAVEEPEGAVAEDSSFEDTADAVVEAPADEPVAVETVASAGELFFEKSEE